MMASRHQTKEGTDQPHISQMSADTESPNLICAHLRETKATLHNRKRDQLHDLFRT